MVFHFVIMKLGVLFEVVSKHMMCTRLLHSHVTDTCVIIKFVNMCILLRWPSVFEITLLSIHQGFFSSFLVTNMFLFCSYEQNAPGGD